MRRRFRPLTRARCWGENPHQEGNLHPSGSVEYTLRIFTLNIELLWNKYHKNGLEENMEILKAKKEDLLKILELQKAAYLSEAKIHNDYKIQPLTQTIEELEKEYENYIILKLVENDNEIAGSIRAYEKNNRVYIGKLMVHPDYQNKGYGAKLLNAIETYYECKTFELFTSTKSEKNLYLYKKNGYKEIKQEKGSGNVVLVFLEKMIKG
jgi:ribosomal protein S18 acetylase RimI-like enzyme